MHSMTSYEMPVLLRSLVHMTINWTARYTCVSFMANESLTCLQACTRLERLTLPCQYLSHSLSHMHVLKDAVQAAKQSHVVEYVYRTPLRNLWNHQ